MGSNPRAHCPLSEDCSSKDRKQGLALLDAVAEAMPHYPLDEAFEAAIPPDLQAIVENWQKNTTSGRKSNW